MELIKKIITTIKKYSMLSHGDTVLIGLSGGPDSVCLSLILDELRDNFNIVIHAVYVDHMMRPEETVREISFCRALCQEKGIIFHERSADVACFARECRINIQEAARHIRYKILNEVADEINADRIALGHNADDQAETVLMRITRGAGRKGLSGIPPVRRKIIRPLIETERDEIENYLSRVSQGFVTDSSNLRDDYFRNWIRHNILLELKKFNPLIIKNICRTASIIREEDEYLEIMVTKTLMRLISRKGDTSIELFLVPMETIDKALLRRILRRAVDNTKGLRGISFTHIEDIINLVKSGKAGDRIILPHGIRAVKQYSTLLISSKALLKIPDKVLSVPGTTEIGDTGRIITAEICGSRLDIATGRNMALIDYSSLSLPLRVRGRRDGDYFLPSGLGKRKKLQDYFVDEKVPRDKRDLVPIIVSGNDIVWVAGYRVDERFKATDKSEKVLLLKLDESQELNSK